MAVQMEPELDAPIPGMSLTAELGARPWQSPPEGATLEEFFELYDKFVCDDIGKILIQVEDNNMADGPPCLEILTDQGYPEGTRNNGLFRY